MKALSPHTKLAQLLEPQPLIRPFGPFGCWTWRARAWGLFKVLFCFDLIFKAESPRQCLGIYLFQAVLQGTGAIVLQIPGKAEET